MNLPVLSATELIMKLNQTTNIFYCPCNVLFWISQMVGNHGTKSIFSIQKYLEVIDEWVRSNKVFSIKIDLINPKPDFLFLSCKPWNESTPNCQKISRWGCKNCLQSKVIRNQYLLLFFLLLPLVVWKCF